MNFLEVWMILRWGKQPSAIDFFMQENVAVVIVRLAISAATLAMKSTGQKAPPAGKDLTLIVSIFFYTWEQGKEDKKIRKNGFS